MSRGGRLPSVARALLLAPFVAPFAWLLVVAAAALAARGGEVAAPALDAWTHPSSLATLPAALLAGLLAAALGLGLGTFLNGARSGPARLLAGLALLPLATPPVFLGGVVADLTGLGPAPVTGGAALLRWGGLVLSWALAFAPLGALVTWAALRAIPQDERRAARLLPSRRSAFRLAVGPAVRGPLTLVVAAVAVLAASDAVLPPHFGVETLASRLLTGFRTSLDAERSAVAAWPVWAALALIAAVALGALPRRVGPRGDGRRAEVEPPASRAAVGLAFAYVAVALAVPLGHATVHAELLDAPAGALAEVAATLAKLGGELAVTLAFAAGGALVGAVAAAAWIAARAASVRPPAASATRPGGVLRRLPLVVPFCAPGVWVGVAAVDLAARADVAVTPAVVVGALALRVLPWAALGALIAARSDLVRAARGAGVPGGRRARLALREEGGAPAAVAAVAVAAAALREVDMFAACAVPETGTLAVRAADALHYGFVADAARPIALQQAALLVLAGALLAAHRLASREARLGTP